MPDNSETKPATQEPDNPVGAASAPTSEAGVVSDVIEIPTPETRPIKCYAFDPSHGKYYGNEMTLNVKYEKLFPGPVGERIAVIDYDGANKRFYTPVDLDHPKLLIRSGLNPSESDPRFHQQMVYAVASETIQNFEAALGRRIRWRRQERTPDADGNWPQERLPEDIRRLNLYPHAMVSANAAYSPMAKGILFGYFRASTLDPGRNLPGQTVFTCLSHDIIVHEVTHAILDGIRSYFSERTSPDVAAFHEAFADIVALFRHFSHKEALLDTIQKTGGKLYQDHLDSDVALTAGNPVLQAQKLQENPLIGLAQQFGEARGTGRALRSALSEIPDPKKMKDPSLEPHERGAILVAAIFDAYFTVYLRQTADLFRLYRAGGNFQTSEISGPLANLLAKAASKTADTLFKICVRAIDYCPVVDITFGDYLRALITADRDNHPPDPLGIRDALMQAFRLRGILPEDAQYFSEESLCWSPVPPSAFKDFEGLAFGDPNGLTRDEKDQNGKVLRAYAAANAEALGFVPGGKPIAVPSFHPAFRLTPDGNMRVDMVVEMSQPADVYYDPERPVLGTFPMRSGSTLLITKPQLKNDKYGPGRLRYLIRKRLDGPYGERRQKRQRNFLLREGLLEGKDKKRFQLDFNMLHSGF